MPLAFIWSRDRAHQTTVKTYLSFALPEYEKPIIIDLERAVELDLRVVLLIGPPVEQAAIPQLFWHLDLPVELKSLCHFE